MVKIHTRLFFTLALWLSGVLTALAQTSGLSGTALVDQVLKNGGLVTFTSQRTASLSITETDDNKLYARTTNADDQSQWWLVQPLTTGGYALRNYKTGHYINPIGTNDTPYPTSDDRSTFYVKQSANATDGQALVTISANNGYSGTSCLHDAQNHAVVKWYAGSGGNNTASDWEMKAVEGFDQAALKAHFAAFDRYTAPANGKVVQIRNLETGTQICESGDGKLFSVETHAGDYSQYWEMEANGSQYAFRNVQTGHYFTYVAGTDKKNVQTATATKSYYTIPATSDKWDPTYHIRPVSGSTYYYTHATSGNGPYDVPTNNVHNTTTDDARTHWFFVEVSLSQEEIDRAKQSYQTYSDLNSKRSTYSSKMVGYFTDASCSVLKDNYKTMDPATLASTMKSAGLPDYLIDIALKIRNNSWEADEDRMSEHFRVNSYKPYSHFLHAVKKTGVGYAFGRLSNPTGIVVKSGDFITLFCGSNQPTGTKLQLEVVEGTEAYGTTYPLSQGMNVFSFSGDATLYIFYQIEDQELATPLANVPDVKIHIEGGRLQGYYDKTRGHTNEIWAHLRENLLKESNVINVKMDNFVFCLDNQIVQDNCPDMERTVDVWDKLAKWENDLMGYNDKFNPNISKYQRNIYNWFSKDYYIGGMMMTGLYGVQVMSGYISGMVNHASMESGAWAPAHENGHLRQNLIYTLGSHEASCNLFSEVVTYELGHSTSRSAFSTDIFDKFAAGKPWADYEGSQISRMLYQLYLYFHVAGHDPEFYPKVFTELRKNPMDHSTRDNVHGGSEYLRLATTMCKVADADLSEFFAAYGFFVPLSTRTFYENGSTWKISTTQAEIDAALAEMHSYSKKLGNIVFIEDRVEQVPATYADAPAGTMKSGYNPEKAGDFGQYTAYQETAPSAEGYTYSMASGGVITVNGPEAGSPESAKGLVGFKVYDEGDNLVYLSNFRTFTLPTSVTSKPFTVKAALSNNTDVVLEASGEIILPEVATPVLGAADVKSNKAYYIYTDQRGGLTIKNANDTRLWGTSESGVNQSVNGNDVLQQFAFISYNDKLYLYSIGAKKFVNVDGVHGKLESTPADPIGFADPNTTDETVRILFSEATNQNFNLNGAKSMDICYWTTKDIGNSFHIVPVADFDPAPVIEALTNPAPNPVLSAAEVNPNKAYYIYTDKRGGLTIKNADDTRLWGTSEGGVGQSVDGSNSLQQFAFISYNDKLYLYSIGAGKFVNSAQQGKLEDTPTDPIEFVDASDGTVRLRFTTAMNFNLGGDKQVAINGWATKDDGNSFIILPAANFNPAPVIAALNGPTIDPDPEPEPEPVVGAYAYSPVPISAAAAGSYIIDACDQQSLTNHHFLCADADENIAITSTIDTENYDNYIWDVFEAYSDNGKYYFVNRGTGKMLNIGNSNISLVDGEGEMPEVDFLFAENNPFAALSNGTKSFDCGHGGNQNSTWEGGIEGSRRMRIYQVEEAEEAQAYVFTLKNKKHSTYAYSNSTAPGNLAHGTPQDEESKKFVFTAMGDGTFTIYLPAADKYVYAINTDDADANVGLCALAEGENGSEDKYRWHVVPNTAGYFNIIPKGGSRGWNCRGNVSGVAVIGQWGSNDSEDNRWQLEPVVLNTPETTLYAVTYHFTNSQLGDYTAAAVSVEAGANYPTIDLPYGVNVNFPTGKVTKDETIDVSYTLAEDFPFVLYPELEDLDEIRHWYKLQVGGKWVGYKQTDEDADPERDVWSTAKPCHFAFVGTPWGFKIFDYDIFGWLGAANAQLSATEPATVVDEEDALEFVFENNNGHYAFRVKSTTNGYLNNLNGNSSHDLGYWLNGNASTDGGSTFTIAPYSLYSIGGLVNLIELVKQGIYDVEDVERYIDLILERW